MIDFYTAPTPNGHKVSCTLEAMGLAYETHVINLSENEQKEPDFLAISPNGRIPAIVDRDANNLAIFESGAIMIYLAEKTGKLMGRNAADKANIIKWVMFQMGGLGPMFGQMGFFVKFAGKDIEDPRPRDRYIGEAKRLLAVVDKQLEGQDWIAGEYSIADIAIAPWLRTLDFYGAREVLEWDSYKNANVYLERFLERPAVQKGLVTPPRP